MKKTLKIKILFYSVLLVAFASCKQEIKEQPETVLEEEVLSPKQERKDDAILEAFVNDEKVIFTNDVDKASKDLVYYDHSAIETSGLNYQIGGTASYGNVIGIGLSTKQVGTYPFSRANKKIFTVDIGIGSADKEVSFERSDKGTITITKNENNLLSGSFSGTGMRMVNTETLEMVSVKIHGTFKDIPLLETPK